MFEKGTEKKTQKKTEKDIKIIGFCFQATANYPFMKTSLKSPEKNLS